jgi:hypothetical protein
VIFENVAEHGAVLAAAEREVNARRAVITPARVITVIVFVPALNALGGHVYLVAQG